MSARAAWLAAGVLALAPGGARAANSVIVPDHVPTLQAAFDSVQVGVFYDSIYVRPGIVTDTLDVYNLGYQFVVGLGDSASRPSIGYMLINTEDFTTFEDFHFTGPIVTRGEANLVFRRCRIDGDFTSPIDGSPRVVYFTRCDITGRLYMGEDGYVSVDSCRFEGGTLAVSGDSRLEVTRSAFDGGGSAIHARNDARGYVRWNTFRNSAIGFESSASEVLFEENLFEYCGVAVQGTGTNRFQRNTVRRCGVGFDITGDGTILENLVVESSGDGIRFRVFENEGGIERNVISRSGGHGVVVERNAFWMYWVPIRNNTSVQNAGSGFVFDLATAQGDEHVTHNIGYGNGAHGIASIGVADPVLACNDWFANDSSAVAGMPPSFADFYLDPMFCDVAHDSVSLFASSPLVNAMHCGLVGARGVGCETATTPPVSVTPSSLVLAPVTPNPSPGPVRFAWSLPREDWVEVTVHDLAGRTIAVVARGVFPPGTHSRVWDGAPSRSGVHFVRVRGAQSSTARSFLVRR